MASITLRQVTAENWRATLRLGVHPEQQRFVADCVPIAAIMLAKAYVRPGGLLWTPFVICADDDVIGMVELAHEPDSPTTCTILHFFIDREWQGRGDGTAALRAVKDLIAARIPSCIDLQLTVHPENRVGQSLYVRGGFRPTGEERDGEPVYVLRTTPRAVVRDA